MWLIQLIIYDNRAFDGLYLSQCKIDNIIVRTKVSPNFDFDNVL